VADYLVNMGYQLLSVVKRACNGGSRGCLGKEDEGSHRLPQGIPFERAKFGCQDPRKRPVAASWAISRDQTHPRRLFIFNLHPIRKELKDKGERNVVVAYYLDGPNQPDRHCV
jgi:hypothetical protein